MTKPQRTSSRSPAGPITALRIIVADDDRRIRMPELDGIQAAHIVSEHVELPFLFVSAYYDDSLVDEASKVFSYGYLVKPIKQQDLATTIPVAMRRFRER